MSAAEPSGLILNPERRSRSEGRYLTWDPTGAGFNNQRQVLRAACRIAFLLNLTVVLPNKKFSKLHHTHDKTAESYDVYFDFEALKKYVPISVEGQLKGLTANSGEQLKFASNNILTFGSRRTSDTWVAVQDKKELLTHTPFDHGGGQFLVCDLDMDLGLVVGRGALQGIRRHWRAAILFEFLRARPPSRRADASLRDRTPVPPPSYAIAPCISSEATAARGEQAGRRNPRAAPVAHRGPPLFIDFFIYYKYLFISLFIHSSLFICFLLESQAPGFPF